MNYERLREDLRNYFGTAIGYNPVAVMNLIEVEKASNEELEQIAICWGFDLNDYKVKRR